MHDRISNVRRDYKQGELDERSAPPDPFTLFQLWLEKAMGSNLHEPTAMALATSTPEGRPSVRMVLLKDFNPSGFTFFTNYESRKGEEISSNPWAAIVFFWDALERQVRIEGVVEKVSEEESDAYFKSRPSGSQASAAISPQSRVIPDRKYLEDRRSSWLARNHQRGVRPSNWGGYRIIPERMEFWQGRTDRMHDRIVYILTGDKWEMQRLAP